MKISIIIPYTLKYGDFINPYKQSIRKHEAESILSNQLEIISVENREIGKFHYTKQCNLGAGIAEGDYLVFSNDDMICTGQFVHLFDFLSWHSRNGFTSIYSTEVRYKTKKKYGIDLTYALGCFFVVPRPVWEAVGPFDENLIHGGVDDIEYSWRAREKGYIVEDFPFPFIHLADKTGHHRRTIEPGFREAMKKNKAYFLEKVRKYEN